MHKQKYGETCIKTKGKASIGNMGGLFTYKKINVNIFYLPKQTAIAV